MAIDIKLIKLMLDEFRVDIHSSGLQRQCLSLGYPDIIIPDDQLDFATGERLSVEVDKASALFSVLGYNVTYIDVKRLRGCEEEVDLNLPLPKNYRRRFDLTFDTGTLEHCFNYSQAFSNMLDTLTIGGRLLSVAPVTMVNHGFFNVCPTLYASALIENGYDIDFLYLRTFEGERSKFVDILEKAHTRVRLPAETALVCSARRVSFVDFSFPIQEKYKALLG